MFVDLADRHSSSGCSAVFNSAFATENIMNKQVIFNLPVKDLEKSKAFFSSLGYRFNSQFSNESAVMMVIAEGSIQAMLMTEAFFGSLIDKPVVQAKEANEVVICLTCESPQELDDLIARAVAAGGRTPHPPEDHGFMYTQGFEDIDGHLWNLVWMAPQG
jgi:predicted lactoylglutathione lyase